ncbi:hypothetical protein JYA61_17960, partial [Sphingomonas pseudosanguinis]|nr:hypothetical protein [Sphingomonas pseudosanguinis]
MSLDGTTLTGTGEAGATVTIRDVAGTDLGTAVVAGDGRFTATLTPAQGNGQLQIGRAACRAGVYGRGWRGGGAAVPARGGGGGGVGG